MTILHQPRWAALAGAFARGIVPQTLLISGPPQVGKFTLARRYAQLLLCPQTRHDKAGLPMPCGHCRVCHQVVQESFPDFQVFRPIVSSVKDEKDWVTAPDALEGSIITVEMARRFGSEALSKPLVGARKVMLLNQADRMNTEAQNALLKTFEEPVSSLTILLLVDNVSSLLPTILSRCWQLPLGLVSDGAMATWLYQEQREAAEPQIAAAVRAGTGRPGVARRELKRLMADDVDTSPRRQQTAQMLERIAGSQPVAALALTEEALRLAQEWWVEDLKGDGAGEIKRADGKVLRSAMVRFLDELAAAYRARWASMVGSQGGSAASPGGSADTSALDLIRKTRHYILRNTNISLALDVLFGKLINLGKAVRKDIG